MADDPRPAPPDVRQLAASRDDEVTLRQLYLTLRAGAWLVLAVALVCGVAAFAWVRSSGPRYVSTATVTVTPPAVGSGSLTGIDVSVPAMLDVDLYRTLALDPDMLAELAEGTGMTPAELIGHLDLVSRTPASQVRGHLTVDHVVTGGNGDVTKDDVADLANGWAEATVAAVARFMTGPIDSAIEAVGADTAALQAAFDAASQAWAAFVGVDERQALEQRLDALEQLDRVQRTRLAMLEGAVAAAEAREAALRAALDDSGSAQGDEAARLVEDQLAVLVGERAALVAERDHLTGVVRGTADDAVVLRRSLGELESRAAALQRDLAVASTAFYRVAPAIPTLTLQRELVARSAMVAAPATTPLQPEPRGLMVTTVAAAALGTLAAVLFVFLRAAVRDPEA